MIERPNFYDFSRTQLEEHLLAMGHKKFRAQQLFRWVYALGETDPEKMTKLSKDFRKDIPSLFRFDLPKIVDHRISQIDGTQKFLMDVGDGQSVEAVLIPSADRLTLCVSSQVGCNMACKFCYTGKQKLKKRLSVGQIVGQFIQASSVLQEPMRITNIVFMGMGEPLDNIEGVFPAIEVLHDSHGINFSRKKITVSTSGLVDRIHLISESGTRLAVSLNGADNDTRTKVMPINKKWPIEELLDACRKHYEMTRDRITFEYVLLKDVTDSLEDARKLYRLTKSVPCKINIIPFNEHPGSGFYRPSEKAIVRFQDELMRLGAHVLRRKTMGRDIYAACGQLTTAAKQEAAQAAT